jgi:hypothetical protein
VYQQGPPAYRGLTTLPGTVAVTCHTSPDVTCPYCANAELVFLMGRSVSRPQSAMTICLMEYLSP